MANKYIIVDFDKFTNKRETSLNIAYQLDTDEYVEKYGDFSFKSLKIRHVSSPGGDDLLLDLIFTGSSWPILSIGKLIININDIDNIELEPHESYRIFKNEYSCKSEESDWYRINQDILKKICDADSVNIQVTGKSVWEFKANGLINYSRVFYNGFYDENAYLDSLIVIDEEMKKKEDEMKKSKRKKLIQLIALPIIILLFFLFLDFISSWIYGL